jgi:hypothetical protein
MRHPLSSVNRIHGFWCVSEVYYKVNPTSIYCVISMPNESKADIKAVTQWVQSHVSFKASWKSCLQVRLFYNCTRNQQSRLFTSSTEPHLTPVIVASILESIFVSNSIPPITAIPSRFISTLDHDDWDFALVATNVDSSEAA